ncbi:L-arabinolactonase [Hartmannibacter diazotrophicus]|uniref:L-arabinolactonase n=1 Tax=Hartmannibacter diazotrophicus TaxID=1482074 RepID=A0A2C9DCI1_9HYPH|nr:SMP-30/gluconolactonase/LRE family protein [Hartmannibacter diazotrophicus]SON58007.1 L-arabinolactonase [Hartmannibacter diazotrophicus]
MRIETPSPRQLIDIPLGTGEGPLWDAANGLLLFIDIDAPALYRLDPDKKSLERFDMPAKIGSFGLCTDGRAIVALLSGIHLFDFATGKLEFIVNPEPDRPGNRLNDGKVGPDGRFWVGSMDDTPAKRQTAALYRIDHDGTATRVLDDLMLSNGLAWSPDGRTMYHSDTRKQIIHAFDYDLATGNLSNERIIARPGDADGRPDGGACDSAGNYWSAGVSAGCLNRYAPDGSLLARYMLPVPAPTMPCFGGPDLKTLYVTSLTRPDQPAGTLISFPAPVAGVPIARFGQPARH